VGEIEYIETITGNQVLSRFDEASALFDKSAWYFDFTMVSEVGDVGLTVYSSTVVDILARATGAVHVGVAGRPGTRTATTESFIDTTVAVVVLTVADFSMAAVDSLVGVVAIALTSTLTVSIMIMLKWGEVAVAVVVYLIAKLRSAWIRGGVIIVAVTVAESVAVAIVIRFRELHDAITVVVEAVA
tara:strand:+ start:184 stop:741 length:558 start_codon:yes stop_codon:yes gene_type:complete